MVSTPSVFNMFSRHLWFWKQRARIAWLVYVRPSVREVLSSILGEITSLFRLLSFLCSLTTMLYIPLKRSIVGERGVKWVHRRPQVYQLNYCNELSTLNIVSLSFYLQRVYNTSALLFPFAPRKHLHRSLHCINPRATLIFLRSRLNHSVSLLHRRRYWLFNHQPKERDLLLSRM